MKKISEVLREAIKDSGQTLYEIAKGAGVPNPTVYRWVEGSRPNISIDTADKLAVYLGLELRPKKQRAKKGKTAGKQAGKK